MSAEREMAGQRDEREDQRVERHADRDDPPGRELGHRDGGHQEPEGDDPEQKQEGPEGCRPARPEEQGTRQPSARGQRGQVEQAGRSQVLAEVGWFLM
jgi:hypothetical protein